MSSNSTLKSVLFFCCFSLFASGVSAQCCSGGSGSPIAGGVSQGVLQDRQFELNTNVQFIQTEKFFAKNVAVKEKYFDGFKSTYEYLRLAYGVSKNFTMSIESGYYFKKQETGLKKDPTTTYESSGIGDLIIFPRYDIINRTETKQRTEVTIGLGFKIPLGSYNDSTGNIEPFSGQTFYVTKPQAVQLSTGAQDIIFYTFFFRGFTEKNFRIFSNIMYIKKGWNPIGEKLGDYFGLGIFAGKSFNDKFGLTAQVRYEWVDKMKLNEDILLHAYPNYNPFATGYKKIFISPQISYNLRNLTFYALTEFPVYQYVTETQVGSQYQTTFGMSYKFFTMRPLLKKTKGMGNYICPMHLEETSHKPARCSKCGMDLEKK